MIPEIGARIGPYRLESELGSGGMGRVFRATVEDAAPGLAVGDRVALKVLHAHLVGSGDYVARFGREVAIGRSVAHENVVRTYDGNVIDGHCYLAMEYVRGQTLRELADELERVPEELCRHVGGQAAKGLAAIHAMGAIHRDIKPENVMITPEHVVKIMDLGIARSVDDELRLSQTGLFVGSLHYASPEQFSDGGRSLDGRVDLYALGLVLYELASGAHPFVAPDMPTMVARVLNAEPRRLGEVNPQLSAWFEEVVHNLLAKDRAARFASADELALILELGEESDWWERRALSLRATTRRPLRRIRIPRETAVYGRETELARLRAVFERSKGGEGQVVLIEGEAGVGKSRLVDEFVGRLRQQGEQVNFLFGSYPPGGAATASGAFSTAYAEQFGSEGTAAYLTDTPSLVPAFDALLRGDAAPAGEHALTKESLQACFVHATRALAAERPTIVLIDDLHFATEEGRALFSALAMAVPGHRVLLIGTTRPGVSESWMSGITRLENASAVVLPRLGAKDLLALLEDTFRSGRLAQELGMRIAAKSDGNPFFVFEIIRGLREGQFIERRPDGTWATTRVIENISIPSSVLDLVNARVADLEEEERDLLDVASCIGFEFDPTLAASVCGMGLIPALKRLGRVEKKHRLVRSAGANYVFDHHQVQEALYGSLHEKLRESYHAAIAVALEDRCAAGGKPDPAMAVALCDHSLAGGDPQRAARHVDRALDHLEASHINDRAAALAGRALATAGAVPGERRRHLLLRAAGFLSTLGRRDAERAALDEALVLAENAGDSAFAARVRDALGLHLLLTGRFEEMLAVLPPAIEAARAADDARTEADATGRLGNALCALKRYDEALVQHRRQAEVAHAAGYAHGEALAAGSIGFVEQTRGRNADARAWHEKYLTLCRTAGDRRGEAIALANLGLVLSAMRSFAAAREHYELSRVVSREIGFRLGEATASGNLGFLLTREGRFGEAIELYERNLSISREIDDRRGVVRSVRNLGDAFYCLGRVEDARGRYEEGARLARDAGDRATEVACMASLAKVLLAMGRGEEARRWLDRGLATARECGEALGEAAVVHALGLCAASRGEWAEAERLHREALAMRRTIGDREGAATTLVALGGHLARHGRAGEARTLLDEGLTIASEIDAPETEVLAVCRRATLPGAVVAGAREHLEEKEARLSVAGRMEARLLLWKATGDRVHLDAATRALDGVLEHVPERLRAGTLTVDMHHEIATATPQSGGRTRRADPRS